MVAPPKRIRLCCFDTLRMEELPVHERCGSSTVAVRLLSIGGIVSPNVFVIRHHMCRGIDN